MPCIAVLVLFAPDVSRADRIFGSSSLSWEHLRREGIEVELDSLEGGPSDTSFVNRSDDITRQSLIVSWEGALFTKNTLRLTANLLRREFPYSEISEFQPIYYLDLRSYGYAFNVRYSPYTRKSQTAGLSETIDVRHRDWRFTGNLNYDRYPSLSAVYTRQQTYDDRRTSFDGLSRNWVLESGYQYGPLSFRGNYNRLAREDNRQGGLDITTETWSGSTGLSRSLSEFAYFSTNYNYYDTRQRTQGIAVQNSNTHSTTSILTITAIPKVTVVGSYAGRFTNSEAQATETSADDQNLSARAEYQPVSYLTGFVGKGYQIGDQGGIYNIVEYWNLGATVTRYLHGGIDTRLTYNRTIFQQSQRTRSLLDSTGAVVGTVNDGDYSLDTYHGSLNFKPLPYVQSYIDLSLNRNSDPIEDNQRYQFNRSFDTRVNVTRRLEGRFTFTSLYEGSVLKLASAFSKSYNVGITYIPRDNLNLNLTWIYSTFAGTVRSENTALTGYISYSFRRAFSAYFSYNYREEKRIRTTPVPGGVGEANSTPESISSQLLVYLSRRATLSLAYVRNQSDNLVGRETVDESVQTVLTLQI